MQIELLLKILVRVIYAELFERVDLERLEGVDIENADEALRLVLRLQRVVDTISISGFLRSGSLASDFTSRVFV